MDSAQKKSLVMGKVSMSDEIIGNIKEALQQVQLIKSGELPKKSWEQLCIELSKQNSSEIKNNDD